MMKYRFTSPILTDMIVDLIACSCRVVIDRLEAQGQPTIRYSDRH